jgi:lipid II:glycine glycyltransferase (peptidoglycan interpeptide bridge formation enzyme)
MLGKLIGPADHDRWDAFLAKESSFALLQSWDWGLFKEKLGWKVFRVVVEDKGEIIAGAQMLLKDLPFGSSIAYVPRGPFGKWMDNEAATLLFSNLEQIARKHRAIFLKIEPAIQNSPEVASLLARHQFHLSRVSNQPQTTILLDLTQDQDNILLQMRKKTRQYIHRAEREGITVHSGGLEDIPTFSQLMHLAGRREHFASRSLKYYQTEWETFAGNHQIALLLAFHQDRLLAVRTVYYFGLHAAEFHGGSLSIPGLHPNYLLAWEAIKWAKAKGCVSYDMWGIPDEIGKNNEGSDSEKIERKDGLWGVYQFKRGFSKNVVSYLGAYDQVFIPGLYFLLNTRLFNGKWWEWFAAIFDTIRFNSFSGTQAGSHGENK